jgi:hypothetical protein
VYQYDMGNIALDAIADYASGGVPTSSAILNWTTPGLPAAASCALTSSDGVYSNAPEPLSSQYTLVVTPAPTAPLPVTYTMTCGVAGGTSSSASIQVPSVSITPSYVNSTAPANGQAFTSAQAGAEVQFNWFAAGIPTGGTCYFSDGHNFNNSASAANYVSLSYFLPTTPGPYTVSIYCTTGAAPNPTTTNTATWTLNLTPPPP